MIDRLDRARLAHAISTAISVMMDDLSLADDPNEADWDGIVSHAIILYHDLGQHLDDLRREHDPPVVGVWKCPLCADVNESQFTRCRSCLYDKATGAITEKKKRRKRKKK